MRNKPLSEHVLYPVFLNLHDIPVLLVGGGEVAYRKAASLVKSGCLLTVVAPRLVPAFEEFLSIENFHWEARAYETGEAGNYFLIVSATDEPEINEQVFLDARSSGCLINVVDRPDLCTIFVPSVLRRNALQIAISTAGKCPALARHLRMHLEEEFPEQYGLLLAKLEIIRGMIKEKIGSQRDRRKFIDRIVSSRAVQEFIRGNTTLLENVIKGWSQAKSRKPVYSERYK